MTKDDSVTDWPDVMPGPPARFRSDPDAATSPSMTAVVPSDLKRRKNVAVPVATAVPAVMALAVRTPDAATPKVDASPVSVARSVLLESAAPTDAGRVPV